MTDHTPPDQTPPEPTPPDLAPPEPTPAVEPAPATPAPPAPGSLANAGDVEAARAAARGEAMRRLGLRDPLPLSIVREYKGKQQKDANSEFAKEAAQFAALGYVVTSQSWAPGQWGCGAFLVAIVLFIVLVGILVFLYMLFVKPAGTLTVTYSLQ